MKRRDFFKVSSAAGLLGLVGRGYDSIGRFAASESDRFDLHPFIKAHPEAVFVNITSVQEKTDKSSIYNAAYKLASEMFVKSTGEEGYPISTKITCKPNWTCYSPNSKDPVSQMGITTDLNFIEGYLNSLRNLGPGNFYLRECACPSLWPAKGYVEMAERNNFDLKDLSSRDFWELEKDDIIFRKIDGVVFREVAFMAPMNSPDTFLINIAKFKAHSMGITGSIKNLQGITGKKFHQFCGGSNDIFQTYDKRYHRFFQPDYLSRIDELHKKHVQAGIPRWDTTMERPPYGGGLWMEQWAQRMLDSYSLTPTGINIVEGIYGRDGDGFDGGPHDGKALDFMSNNIIFGKDPFRVDIITHWLAGHEPGNFGLFHIGIERGLSDVLDPNDIPVYLWKNGRAKKVNLDSLKRTPLLTYYLKKNTNGLNEERYHMCDEPFDYSSWKIGKISRIEEPSVKTLGMDSNENVVMEVSLPEISDVYMDILNKDNQVVWRLHADSLEPGVHQVVWDGFSQPGLYNIYVKGMNWDAKREMIIYT
jgi:hypothetical protein